MLHQLCFPCIAVVTVGIWEGWHGPIPREARVTSSMAILTEMFMALQRVWHKISAPDAFGLDQYAKQRNTNARQTGSYGTPAKL